MKRNDQKDRPKRVDPALKRGREYHRLWYEYLRRSDTYHDLCDWLHEHPEVKARIGIGPVAHTTVTIDGPGFKQDEWTRLLGTYKKFGDVYRIPFDLRWVFMNGMTPPSSDRHRDLRVDLEQDIRVIKGAIRDLQKQYRGEKPLPKEKHQQLGDFLKIYDIWSSIHKTKSKRKWWNEAIRKVFKKGLTGDDYESNERKARKHLLRAQRIIKNVERGEFPGKYR